MAKQKTPRKPKALKNPLAEVFGYPIANKTEEAQYHRDNKLCPYHNKVAKCTKVSVPEPLGVCSINHETKLHGKPEANTVITCPVRFRQDWRIISDAAKFFFGDNPQYVHLPEVRIADKEGKDRGNIDYLLVQYDDQRRVVDFASLEIQAVYISGNISDPFNAYMGDQQSDFSWPGPNYPRPDYLSSSNKRLVPQILIKGGMFKQWGKKQGVALQRSLFNRLKTIPPIDKNEADLAWFLYDLCLSSSGLGYELTLVEIVYTKYQDAIDAFILPKANDINIFTKAVEEAVDAKLSGRSLTGISIIGEDEEAEKSEEEDDHDPIQRI